MKKILILISIFAIISMPLSIATSNQNNLSSVDRLRQNKPSKIQDLPEIDYDGTFIGGIGRIYKENNEWSYETYSYIAGIYEENGNNKKLYGHIYNMDQEQIGYIGAYCSHSIILGRTKNMEDKKVPIIGFLFFNEENFAGRIMSLFGPAPHIWGTYTPN
jgi:hypothetical protein